MRIRWRQPLPGRLVALIVAALWLALISALHHGLNSEPRSGRVVPMGYMPVITNLSAPLVDFASRGDAVHFQALKFSSFAEMAESFRAGYLQVAFIIAPLAIVLYEQGVPLKVVYIGNRHESTLVVRKDLPCRTVADLAGRTVAVPIRFSGHLLALSRYLREHGLPADSIRIVEIQPPDMPAALSSGQIDGYFVGEPFASKSIVDGIGRRLAFAEDIWPGFICNLVIVRDELIRDNPELAARLVNGAVRAGLFARSHLKEAERIACQYWGQKPEVVSRALLDPPGRARFDLYVPVLQELEEIAGEMKKMGLLKGPLDLRGMVEPAFAEAVDTRGPNSLREVFR